MCTSSSGGNLVLWITRFYYANNTEVLRGGVCAIKRGWKVLPLRKPVSYIWLHPQSPDSWNFRSFPWFLLIPRFMLCSIIGLRLLCLYAVFVSLSNNSASSQVSKRNPLRGRGSCPWSTQSHILFLCLILCPQSPTPSPWPAIASGGSKFFSIVQSTSALLNFYQ